MKPIEKVDPLQIYAPTKWLIERHNNLIDDLMAYLKEKIESLQKAAKNAQDMNASNDFANLSGQIEAYEEMLKDWTPVVKPKKTNS